MGKRVLYTKKEEQSREQRTKQSVQVYTAEYKVNHSIGLLDFLLQKCKQSRNNVKTVLSKKQVLVNGVPVTQFDFPLAKDDEVKISKTPVCLSVKRNANVRKPPASASKSPLKILYEDDDFIAVDKPCGLLSVENEKERNSAFSEIFPYLQKKGCRPYALHRIDKETSGVLVFAKNPKIYTMLKLKWNDLVKTREYVAVVEGTFTQKSDTLISYLKETNTHIVYSTSDPTGQKAITHYTVEREKEGYSFLRVTIDTGRKNQIRVQMNSISHPVVGDDKYGAPKNPLKRLGLHASKLEFIHPVNGEVITISSPVPVVFEEFFK